MKNEKLKVHYIAPYELIGLIVELKKSLKVQFNALIEECYYYLVYL